MKGRMVEELLLVLKWGGVLTHAGRKQAEDLGTYFRSAMYPRWAPPHPCELYLS